jgi:hypothetical protein
MPDELCHRKPGLPSQLGHLRRAGPKLSPRTRIWHGLHTARQQWYAPRPSPCFCWEPQSRWRRSPGAGRGRARADAAALTPIIVFSAPESGAIRSPVERDTLGSARGASLEPGPKRNRSPNTSSEPSKRSDPPGDDATLTAAPDASRRGRTETAAAARRAMSRSFPSVPDAASRSGRPGPPPGTPDPPSPASTIAIPWSGARRGIAPSGRAVSPQIRAIEVFESTVDPRLSAESAPRMRTIEVALGHRWRRRYVAYSLEFPHPTGTTDTWSDGQVGRGHFGRTLAEPLDATGSERFLRRPGKTLNHRDFHTRATMRTVGLAPENVLKIWCPSGRGGSIPPPGTKAASGPALGSAGKRSRSPRGCDPEGRDLRT